MKVAITGATGFIGSALATALHAAGHEILMLDLRTSGALPDPAGAQAVVHLAAIAHRRGVSRQELQRVNVELPREVGRWARAAGMRMLFLSTAKVHGERSTAPFREASPLAPQDEYAESKARAEDALRAIAGLRLAVLRPPLVYGPAVKANFLALLRAVARGLPLPFAGLANRRSFLYVENLADACLRCLNADIDATYLVCDGPSLSTAQLCAKLGRALGRPARLFRFPRALLPDKLTESLEVDDTLIRQGLRWVPPYSLDEGLVRTAHWYRDR